MSSAEYWPFCSGLNISTRHSGLMTFYQNVMFLWKKCIWKCCLQNVHFVPVSVHYNEVIMSAMVSNHQPHDCLLKRLFTCRSKKTSKLCVTGLCEGNSSATSDFPAQMASNAENVSIWWRHHGIKNHGRYSQWIMWMKPSYRFSNTFPTWWHHSHREYWFMELVGIICISAQWNICRGRCFMKMQVAYIV